MIETTKGLMDESLLDKRDGELDNDNEHTTWTEYYLDGELVHRSAHVMIKQGISSGAIAGAFS